VQELGSPRVDRASGGGTADDPGQELPGLLPVSARKLQGNEAHLDFVDGKTLGVLLLDELKLALVQSRLDLLDDRVLDLLPPRGILDFLEGFQVSEGRLEGPAVL